MPMNRVADQPEPNPTGEGLSTRAVPQPCAIVIFGATGDLTHRKLIPALYNLAADGELPAGAAIVGFARRKKRDEEFRRDLEEATSKFSRQPVRDEIWKTFGQSIFYLQSEFGDESGYEQLAKRLDEIDKTHGTRGNRLFYFAAGPDQFEPILKHLKAAGLNETRKGSWVRVIVEKPFGTDLTSARELNRIIHNSFTEEQTYRIDHFLGKETAQNILVLRFANAIFAPLWNTHYIDQVQITAAETLGVGTRAGYYEGAGALADVRIYMRVGKRLPKSATEISIHFKKAPAVLFNKDLHDLNVLVIRIQPDEGISLRIHAKVPGTSFHIEPVKMDFHYGTSFGRASPEAYERLLLDAMSGDATLFARRDEVEQAWAFIDPIEEIWHAKKGAPEWFFYSAGSWGPEAADDLLARDGRPRRGL